MGELFPTLPEEEHESIHAPLRGGRSVGIETLVDRRQSFRVSLVDTEREGRRLVLAEVSAPGVGQLPSQMPPAMAIYKSFHQVHVDRVVAP